MKDPGREPISGGLLNLLVGIAIGTIGTVFWILIYWSIVSLF